MGYYWLEDTYNMSEWRLETNTTYVQLSKQCSIFTYPFWHSHNNEVVLLKKYQSTL